jgi:hypothetical protein
MPYQISDPCINIAPISEVYMIALLICVTDDGKLLVAKCSYQYSWTAVNWFALDRRVHTSYNKPIFPYEIRIMG